MNYAHLTIWKQKVVLQTLNFIIICMISLLRGVHAHVLIKIKFVSNILFPHSRYGCSPTLMSMCFLKFNFKITFRHIYDMGDPPCWCAGVYENYTLSQLPYVSIQCPGQGVYQPKLLLQHLSCIMWTVWVSRVFRWAFLPHSIRFWKCESLLWMCRSSLGK